MKGRKKEEEEEKEKKKKKKERVGGGGGGRRKKSSNEKDKIPSAPKNPSLWQRCTEDGKNARETRKGYKKNKSLHTHPLLPPTSSDPLTAPSVSHNIHFHNHAFPNGGTCPYGSRRWNIQVSFEAGTTVSEYREDGIFLVSLELAQLFHFCVSAVSIYLEYMYV